MARLDGCGKFVPTGIRKKNKIKNKNSVFHTKQNFGWNFGKYLLTDNDIYPKPLIFIDRNVKTSVAFLR